MKSKFFAMFFVREISQCSYEDSEMYTNLETLDTTSGILFSYNDDEESHRGMVSFFY